MSWDKGDRLPPGALNTLLKSWHCGDSNHGSDSRRKKFELRIASSNPLTDLFAEINAGDHLDRGMRDVALGHSVQSLRKHGPDKKNYYY